MFDSYKTNRFVHFMSDTEWVRLHTFFFFVLNVNLF